MDQNSNILEQEKRDKHYTSLPFIPMGTRQWWDYYFGQCWEANGGPKQTHYFMEELIAHLPATESAYLRANSLTILDWGCATGEGVELLGKTFPRCQVSGLDFAQPAIETAKTRYPRHDFILTREGEVTRPYDVILTSNCLEHFEEPITVARGQIAASRLLYMVLVPCREYPLLPEHLVTFTEESFPEFLGGFVRLAVKTFATDPKAWAGKQTLVVYGSQEYVSARPHEAGEISRAQQQDWAVYFQSPPEVRALLEDLAVGRARAEMTLGGGLAATQQETQQAASLRAQVGEKDQIIRARDEAIAWLQGELAVSRRAPQPAAQTGEGDKLIGDLQAELHAKDQMIQALRREAAERE